MQAINHFFRKEIIIKIIDDEEYEKREEFFVELDDPIWIEKLSSTYVLISFCAKIHVFIFYRSR